MTFALLLRKIEAYFAMLLHKICVYINFQTKRKLFVVITRCTQNSIDTTCDRDISNANGTHTHTHTHTHTCARVRARTHTPTAGRANGRTERLISHHFSDRAQCGGTMGSISD